MNVTFGGDARAPQPRDPASSSFGPPSDSGPATRFGESLPGSELPVRFTASGSEYFRIWIVNLLLTLVTLGLYHPWAKVRKLRYFYGNTWVGDHALDFHGDPTRMLRGTLLVGALFIAYSVAGQFSPIAGGIAALAVAALWPALFRASMRFRLANTSWRGMRFHFTGDMAGAYKTMLPVLIPGVLIAVLIALAPEPDAEPDAAAAAASATAQWVMAGFGMAMLASLLLVPFMLWSIKRYQHDHYALGRVQSSLRTGPGSFYGLFAKAAGVSVLSTMVLAIVVAGVAAIFGFGAFAALTSGGLAEGGLGAAIFLVFLVVGVGYVVVMGINNTYLASRLQNLVWGRTKSTEVRFESRLRLLPLLGLTLKNWLLLMLTLGLYWPFAAVALARLKLEAITIHTRRPVEALAGRAGQKDNDATGDAAGDIFGIDFGL